jgi:hydrogenase maturation protease
MEIMDLVIGIGNNGRQDDGLGWAFLDSLSRFGFNGQAEYRYQLQVEDAELIARHPRVLFVDAHEGALENGFSLTPCRPSREYSFTTHAVKPSTLLYLSEDLYDKTPEAWILLIEGKEWDMDFGLGDDASKHLIRALQHMEEIRFFEKKIDKEILSE